MRRVFAFVLVCSVQTIVAAEGTPPAPWTVLDEALKSAQVEHRQQTIAALSTLGASNEDAVRRIEDALRNDKSPRVRQQAALALGQMKATEAIPLLKQTLQDSNEAAFGAAKALMDMGDTSGLDLLVDVIAGERKDTPGMLTNARRTAEHKLRHPQGLMLMGIEDATGSMFAPGAMGIMAIQDAAGLRGKGAPGRASAVAYVAKDNDPYAVTLLEWALSDDSHLVRLEAAKALGERGNAGSIAKLRPLLKDDHVAVRAMAAASIIRLGGK